MITPLLINTKLTPFTKLALFLIIVLVLVTPWFLTPNPSLIETHRQLLLPPCPLYYFTKIPCMFCGSTTSFSYLVHGDIVKALTANPVAPLFYFLLVFGAIILAKGLLRREPLQIDIAITCRGIFITVAIIWGLKLLVWFIWVIKLKSI